ncbi:MAG: diphthamide synthesis protein [Ignisphaera sp.]
MDFCKDFDFDIDRVVKVVKENKVQRILIQLPEGFYRCYNYIAKSIRDLAGEIDIILSLNPSHGPCLVDEYTAREVGAELILHFGHTEYPLYRPSINTLFVPVEYVSADFEKIGKMIKDICSKNKKICITTTAQHTSLARKLNHKDCDIIFKGISLGCMSTNVSGCANLVVIAGGMFNCISQYLMVRSRDPTIDVMCVDPYTYRLWSPVKEVDRIMRIRLWKTAKASEGRRWLIVTGFYGQSREDLVDALLERLRNKGLYVDVAKVLKLDRNVITNIGSNYDVIVVASCPYLAFDFYDVDVPVITPGEALMVIDDMKDRYVYPW